MNLLQRVLKKTSVWTLVAAITFLVQTYRAVFADMVIFGAATLLIHCESSGAFDSWKFKGLRLSGYFLNVVTGASLVFLYLSKRQDPLLGLYFLVLVPLLFLWLWSPTGNHHKLSKREFRSSIFWSLSGLAVAVWESLAIILSGIEHSDKSFPTLSDLTFPALESANFRLAFIVIWLGLGNFMIRKWKRP